MTQADAKRAVRHILRGANALKELYQQEGFNNTLLPGFNAMIEDLNDLLRQLEERKQAKPNCRPVTAAELSALCSASNVVTFQPAA